MGNFKHLKYSNKTLIIHDENVQSHLNDDAVKNAESCTRKQGQWFWKDETVT